MKTGTFFLLPPYLFSLKMDFKYIVILKSLKSESSEKEQIKFYFKTQGKDLKKKKQQGAPV